MSDITGTKKIIRLQLEKPVPIEDIKEFGMIKEYTRHSATIEIDRDSVKEKAKKMLGKLPIIDLTIEDIPIEETVALLYQYPEKRE
jgi:ABC-2 type transport system ATP-binding protein